MIDENSSQAQTDSDSNPIQQVEVVDFVSIFSVFRYRIACLGKALNMIGESRTRELSQQLHSLNKYSKTNNIPITQEIEGSKVNLTFSIPVQHVKIFQAYQTNMSATEHASYILRRNLIVSLVSEFDNLLAELIKLAFRLHPNLLDSSNRSLTLGELSKFSTVDEAREYLIDKEVETILRENHSKQLDYIENKFNLKELKKIPGWKNFIEVTERRNIFVHCDGIVSRQYINVCKENKIDLPTDCQLNSQLDVDDDYFARSYEDLLKIGTILTQKIWRQLKRDEHTHADDLISQLCFEMIVLEDYDLAIEILNFSEDNFYGKQTTEITKMNSKLNKAQAYKWKGDIKKMKLILAAVDFSASSNEFKMVNFVLQDNFVEAAKLVEKIGSTSDTMKEESYTNWPIFKEFVKSDEFAKAFELAFDHRFDRNVEASIEIPEVLMSDEQLSEDVDTN